MTPRRRFPPPEETRLAQRASQQGATLSAGDLRRLARLDLACARRTVDEVCRIIRAARGEEIELSFPAAHQRLDAAGGNVAEATRRVLWSLEHRPGMPEAIAHADAVGVSLAPRTIHRLLRRRGLPATLRYMDALGAMMDHAVKLGLSCPQSLATWRLSRAGDDLDAAIADLTAERRRRVAQLSGPCSVSIPPAALGARANAFAGCGCPRCRERLAAQLHNYIGRMLADPYFRDLGHDEGRGVANEELIRAVESWPGGNFTGWFSRRFRTRVRSLYAARSQEEREQLSLDAPAVLADDGDGRLVPLGERVPDRSIDVAEIVILRELLATEALAQRAACAARADDAQDIGDLAA